MYSIALGCDWNDAIPANEDELNFIKAAMAFFYAHYHGKYLLGGSSNQNGEIDFLNYLADDSGTKDLLVVDFI